MRQTIVNYLIRTHLQKSLVSAIEIERNNLLSKRHCNLLVLPRCYHLLHIAIDFGLGKAVALYSLKSISKLIVTVIHIINLSYRCTKSFKYIITNSFINQSNLLITLNNLIENQIFEASDSQNQPRK